MIEQKVEMCQEHSLEFVVAIDEAEEDLKIRKLCLKCLAKGYKRKVTLIKDSIHQIEETKGHLLQDRQFQLENNIKSLRSLIQNIELLKDFYIQEIETIIEVVKKWILYFQNMEEEFINKIQTHDQNDIQQFLKFYKEQPQFQNNIQALLLNMKETDLLNKCTNILLNIHSISTVFENNLRIDDETNDNVELNLQCDDHPQKRIILLDVGQERIHTKRLACECCMDNHPSLNYKSITYAYSQWKQILSKRQENMKKNLESMKKKWKKFKTCYNRCKTKLNSNYNCYEINVDEIQNKMNLSWKKLSQEEISKIAEELSKINQPSIFDDPLLNQYKTSDNQVNKIVQDILIFLQECQVTQLNQLNPFIKSQIFEKIDTQLQVNTKKEIDCQTNFQEIYLQVSNQEIQYSMQIQKGKSQNVKLQLYPQVIQIKYSLKQKENLKQFTYEIIKESSIKQDERCSAVAFNKDNSIVVIGCDKQIKLFEFKQGMMKQIQLLSEHQNKIATLTFMKKANQFISGSLLDGQMIIWVMNKNNQWISSQKLNGHSKGISCVILNNNEDLIISSSFDKTIKFWVKQNEWTCQQIITDHQKDVNSFSLNEKQNKLISCSDDKNILIIEYSEKDQQWIIKQKIVVEDFGIRLCFINDNLFTFQPYQKGFLHVYELNSSNGQYNKTKDVQVKFSLKDGYCHFPQQYIKQKNLLVNKNGQYINLMKKNQNGEFEMGQFIEYQTSSLYGCMSDNAEYLITWDDNSKEIQIRKYQEK